MKRLRRICTFGIAFISALCFALWASLPVRAGTPSLSARAAVLMDAMSGEVLFAQNAEEFLPMASTTKIMTALLAFESGRAAEPVTVTEDMVRVEGSSMGLMAGDVLPLGALAEGMLMASGNDGANAVALYLGGDEENFAAMMNRRAKELGMENTCFVTPSGLDAEGHGSTALDMARLAVAAMQCPAFAAAVGQKSLPVSFLEPEKTVRYENHNRLLSLYPDCTGIKTGYTKKAGRCLVSAAERDGARLVCVTLNDPDDWNDHAALFDYGFTRFAVRSLTKDDTKYFVPVAGGTKGKISVHPGGEASAYLFENAAVEERVLLPRFLYAPVQAGEEVGEVIYLCGGEELARVPLLAEESISTAADPRGAFERWFADVRRFLRRMLGKFGR